MQARRERRQLLQQKIDEHATRRPDPSKMDPQDSARLLDMQRDLGDFKLKTSPDYIVPPSERTNTSMKRSQLVALRQRIADAKSLFNTHVQTLLQRKRTAIAKLQVIAEQLHKVQRLLNEPTDSVPLVHALDDEELPSRKTECTSESLLAFKASYALQLEQERDAAAKAQGGGFGGFSGFGGATSKPGDGPACFRNAIAELKAAERKKLETLLQTHNEAGAQAHAQLYFERQRLAARFKEVADAFDQQLLTVRPS
jgi:hypothetical protein